MSRITIPVEDERVKEMLGHLGILEVAQLVRSADETRTTELTALRLAERAQVLGLDDGQLHVRKAELGIETARRQLTLARKTLRARLESTEWNELAPQLDEVSRSPDGQRVLAEGEELWRRKLLDIDMSKEDAAEIIAMYGQMMEHINAGGITALFEAVDGHLGELIDQSQVDFGRQPHSPLEWWEWLIIIVIVGVSIYFLINCLFWAGCAWVLHFLYP